MTRLNLHDAVMDLHPDPPPCFINRLQWIEYLQSAAACQNHISEPKVIIIVGYRPQFNYRFNYCEDCTQIKSFEMMSKNRCNPNHLLELEKQQ